MANGFIGQVNIGSDSHLIGSTLFATSSTPSNDGAKVAALQGSAIYTSTTGITIHVKFEHGNTVTTGSSLTLAVGNDTAHPIVNPNGALTWNDNSIISFTYDGTNWVINSSGIDASSTSLTLGNISSSGTLTNTAATIATGDYLVITDASDNSGRIAKANLSFDTTKTDYFLSQAGSWTQINKTILGLNNVTNHAQVTSLQWDSTNKKITYKVSEGSAQNVVEFEQGSNITLNAAANKLTIASTNNAVTQTNTTGNATYDLLFSSSTSTTDSKTEGARKHSGSLTYNPSTGILSATKFSGDGSELNNVTASSVALENVTGADDLKKIEALTGTSGLLKKTAANTWTLDTTSYATSAEVSGLLAAADAMTFKGTIGAGGTINTTNNETLPTTHTAGDTYKVITAGTYAGQVCEVGDLIICIKDVTNASNAANSDWTVTQTNIDGAVTGPATSTANHIATFNDGSGKIIKDSGYTIATSVPSGAIFTDKKVEQKKYTSDTNSEFRLLFKKSANNTDETDLVYYSDINNKNITYNPHTGTLSAAIFKGSLDTSVLGTDSSITSALTFYHKSGNWKTLQITNTTTTIASVANGVLTLTTSVAANAALGIAT